MKDLEEKPGQNVNLVQGISWQKHQNNEEQSLPFLSHTGDITEEATSTSRTALQLFCTANYTQEANF